MNKITISTGSELYQDIKLISHHRLSSQTLSNVKKTFKLSIKTKLLSFSYLFQAS
jgi:hypothetical protein